METVEDIRKRFGTEGPITDAERLAWLRRAVEEHRASNATPEERDQALYAALDAWSR